MDASKPVSFGSGAPATPKSPKSTSAAPAGPATDKELLLFALTECKTFFGKLATAVQNASEDGSRPSTLFSLKALNTKAEAKPKRKPTAFNIFVAKKCEQMRASGAVGPGGVENNNVFGQAAAAWTALSDEQKHAYILLYSENKDDPALDDLPEPAAAPKAPVEVEVPPKIEDEAPVEVDVDVEVDPPKTTEKKKRKKEETLEASAIQESKLDTLASAAEKEGQKKKKKKRKSVGPAVEG